jgi:hypothetical protein
LNGGVTGGLGGAVVTVTNTTSATPTSAWRARPTPAAWSRVITSRTSRSR